MTRKLNESTDSEGICADIGSYRNHSSAASMSSSICNNNNNNNERMFLSTVSTPRRLPSRIPALMTKSLCTPRSMSTPSKRIGSGEQLCDGSGLRNSIGNRLATEMLLSRSQDRQRQQRASSYEPRCLMAIQSNNPMTSSVSFSRLLPRRPQWVRSQGSVQLAESSVSLDSASVYYKKPDFSRNFESESESDSGSEYGFDVEDTVETPKARRKKPCSIRRLKDKNRQKFRNSIRRLQRPVPAPESVPLIPPEFLCVSSPFFYLALAFLFRILLFLTELCF